MFRKALLGALTATAFALPAAAQEYVVGVTAALTGPPSSTYAPAVDAMRIYIDRVNAAGGVNGRKIRLVIEDDGAQPSKAAANTKKLITQDNVVLMVNASLSSTYAPVIAESKSAEVPLLFASGVCPQSVYPPADPLQFCTTGYASHFDSQATLDFVKATAKGPVKIGFSAMAIPLSRGEMDYAQDLSKTMGMMPVDEQVIPPPTADYTPFATKLKDAGITPINYGSLDGFVNIHIFAELQNLDVELAPRGKYYYSVNVGFTNFSLSPLTEEEAKGYLSTTKLVPLEKK